MGEVQEEVKEVVQEKKELSLNEKIDLLLGMQAEEEQKKAKNGVNVMGARIGIIWGFILGTIAAVVVSILWNILYGLGAGAVIALLSGIIISKMKWSFWIPMNAKVSKKKMRQGWIIGIKVMESGLDFEKYQIKDGVIVVDKVPRVLDASAIKYYKKKPFVIVFERSLKVFNPSEWIEKATVAGLSPIGFRTLLDYAEKSGIEDKKKGVSMGLVFGLLALVAGAGFVAYKFGWI